MQNNLKSTQDRVTQGVLDSVNSCRGRVLNIVEAQLGDSPTWRIVRGQLLNVFGEKGIAGDIQRAIDDAFAKGQST